MTREKNKCTHTLINPRKKKKHNTQTSKQNATERASSSVKNEVQKRREKNSWNWERKAIQAREDGMTNKIKKHRRIPKFKAKKEILSESWKSV